ncbi:IncA protein [Chlamydia serpentis]|uniref:IncA protein n=1 Tax=Chlamydia serpentis TaxID=1967782 RepID=A0A2R8FAR0_9CHLA|nr:hypothetical protein [Chlamydia serpentis]SPN73412.1 IncA protein [Chlamydia serpentis]
MSLSSTNTLLKESEAIDPNTYKSKYINENRKVFGYVVTQLVIATLVILIGVALLCSMGSFGLSVPLSAVIGSFITTLGTVIFAIGLIILAKKSLGTPKTDKDLTIPQNDTGNKSTPLKSASPITNTGFPISKFRIISSIIGIILGVCLLICALISVFFCTGYLQLGLCAGFVGLGTIFFTTGLEKIRSPNLITEQYSESMHFSSKSGDSSGIASLGGEEVYGMSLIRGEDGKAISIRLIPYKK